jgi:hypothetical protein
MNPEPPPGFDGESPTPPRGTTFREVVDVAKDAAEKVTGDGKVDAEELVEAGVAAAAKLGIGNGSGEHPPLPHHMVTELRKFLVPVITTLAGLVAGGAGGWWHGEVVKDDAVKAVRTEEREASEARDEARKLIREAIERRVRSASWDDVGKTVRDIKPEDLLVGLKLEAPVADEQVMRIAVQQLEVARTSAPLPRMAAQPPGD